MLHHHFIFSNSSFRGLQAIGVLFGVPHGRSSEYRNRTRLLRTRMLNGACLFRPLPQIRIERWRLNERFEAWSAGAAILDSLQSVDFQSDCWRSVENRSLYTNISLWKGFSRVASCCIHYHLLSHIQTTLVTWASHLWRYTLHSIDCRVYSK